MARERKKAVLALADGRVFHGHAVGAIGETHGEVVFNTSMSGYQEVLTDPSYCYQLLTFTYPHIGNVGVNSEDVESDRIQVSGVIVRELTETYSNYRAQGSLEQYLIDSNIVGIEGLDTRELVLHVREHGAQIGVISSISDDETALVEKARAARSMEGLDLVQEVTAEEAYDWKQGVWQLSSGYREYSDKELEGRPLVLALDLGIKYNILRLLVDRGFRVRVVPASTSAEEILAMNPDGIFLSNGPGDPAAVEYAIETVRSLLGKKPMFGICLGHQILSLALGLESFKLKFGHRGANHPVRDKETGVVEITVQNHGFAIRGDNVPPGVEVTRINLNDQTVAGMKCNKYSVFAAQYHPEASPGPLDAQFYFDEFYNAVSQRSVN